MKRLHLHINVDDLEHSVAFYTTLFGAAPQVRKADYAKWLLDDPWVNLAISSRGRGAGLDHLGIQVESRGELDEVSDRLKDAGRAVLEQADAKCCYAVSDKTWTADPSGLAWETFHSSGEITHYGSDTVAEADRPHQAAAAAPRACCP